MNLRKKWILVCMLILSLALLAGCKSQDAYKENDKLGYNVSVKFDANGGSFTSANTPVIVDSFNVSEMTKNGEGKVEIPLMSPTERKNITMQNGEMFLIGWYKQRTENPDGTYTYAEPWNFETDRVIVDPNAEHSSQDPVMTLYAAWAPQFTIEFCNMDSAEKEVLSAIKVLPTVSLDTPAWNESTGTIQMGGFPAREGYTFMAAYYDVSGTQPVEGATLSHSGTINMENGTVENPNMKVYLSWKTGDWYKIYTAKQFANHFSPAGCYDIQADLDFTDVIWPTNAMHGDFSGVIQGNGYKISNIVITQTNANKMNTGLFGNVTSTAGIRNLTFDNVELVISTGSRLSGVTYGLLAGNISSQDSVQDVTITNSRILVEAKANMPADSYFMGLVCGMGTTAVDYSGITCEEKTTEQPNELKITVTDQMVTVEKLSDLTTEEPIGEPVEESAEEPTEIPEEENT